MTKLNKIKAHCNVCWKDRFNADVEEACPGAKRYRMDPMNQEFTDAFLDRLDAVEMDLFAKSCRDCIQFSFSDGESFIICRQCLQDAINL